MRDLLGWASGAVVVASLICLAYGVAVWGFGRASECCPHSEAGQ